MVTDDGDRMCRFNGYNGGLYTGGIMLNREALAKLEEQEREKLLDNIEREVRKIIQKRSSRLAGDEKALASRPRSAPK